MRHCDEKTRNEKCKCTNTECARHGLCCECLESHWSGGSFPACMFPREARGEHPNNVEGFVAAYKEKGPWW